MSTVLRIKGYRIMIYTGEQITERPHVHILKDRLSAKIWIDRVEIAKQGRYSEKELREILAIVDENQDFLLEKWSEIHG